MSDPRGETRTGRCRAPRCGQPSVAVALSDRFGEIEVCRVHAEDLAGGPIDHACDSQDGVT